MRSWALAALIALGVPAYAQLSSDAAWTRFAKIRPGDARVAQFNRMIFREYGNLALFAGEAYSDRVPFLEDFLLHFPRTAVFSGHAALIDWQHQAHALRWGELNLFVLDERTWPRNVSLKPLLDQVDRWNRDGYVVKVIVHVTDPAAVLSDTLIFRGEFVEFTAGYAASIRRAFDELTPAPSMAKAWRTLIDTGVGRHKVAMTSLSQVVRSPSQTLLVLAGTSGSNAGVSEAVRREMNLAPVIEYSGEAKRLVPEDPRRRFDLNLVRVRVSKNLIGQWPPAEGLGQLADSLVTVNREGVFTRSIIEVTEPAQLPSRIRAQSKVVATANNCEQMIRWSD